MTVEESLAAFAPVLAPGPRPRVVAARVRVDRVRMPVHGSGEAADRRRRRARCSTSASMRSVRRHDRCRRAERGRGAGEPRRGRASASAGRPSISTTRGTALANVTASLAAGSGRSTAPRAGPAAAPTLRRRRQPRDGGPRVLPRRIGMDARRRPGRRARGGPVHRGHPGQAAQPRSARRAAGTSTGGRTAARSRAPARRTTGGTLRVNCYPRHHGRRGARAQPELRAAQRLQHPACVPARLRREGRGHRVRPPRRSAPSARRSARPSVIRLQHQIRRPRPRVKLTRREIFARDRHTCQYCGRPDPRPDARPRACRATVAAATPGRTSSPRASRATTARAAARPTRRACA